MSLHIFEHKFTILPTDRIKLLNQEPVLIWFTGLSGSGKSTIANALEHMLHHNNFKTSLLDGDSIRMGINADLGFSEADRVENLRRIAHISKLMMDSGLIVLAAFVSPFRKDRELVKEVVGAANFIEIFVDTSLETCEKRDVKGLYKKARAGEIQNFTGINQIYEAPEQANLVLREEFTLDQSIQFIYETIKTKISIHA
ncbi:MAG: adenylyl-sulfate kinase [Sphingobacteriaceae bacterium]|nr:adenylyl-sulfate kinase [Sphingobacteriaceae bacterium]